MSQSPSEEQVSLRTWIAVLGTILGAFMAVLDIQITNASLREITGGIASTAVEASWVSTSYLIGEIVTIPLTTWLGRVFGTRLYLLVNVSLFLLFSGLCGTASELTQMIIYRALQGFTGGTWDLVINRLKTDFRCIAYDHRGWGESDKPETGYSIQDLANDAEALIRTLELTRYVLIGHSMGGKVAQLLASKRPEGLKALILVAPAPPSPMNLTEAERKQRIQAYENREALEFLIQNVLTAVPLPAQIREQIIEDTLKGAMPAKYAWPEKGMLEDLSRAVLDICVPTLVLAGENDQVEKFDLLERVLVPNIPTARMTIIPETGHLSPLEVPDKIASEIRVFLRG